MRDAAIGTGIAVDKMLALTGQIPTVQRANIVMPSAEDRAKIDVSHRALDAIARRLVESQRRYLAVCWQSLIEGARIVIRYAR
jgi:hypothetical protein